MGQRQSCINNDLPAELDLLVKRVKDVRAFLFSWLELGEKIGHMAVAGEEEL